MIRHKPGIKKDLERIQEELSKKVVKVGYFEHSKYAETGEQIAYIATIHEFGSPQNNIPPRPTLYPGLKKAAKQLRETVKNDIKKAIANKGTVGTALDNLGLHAQAAVRDEIRGTTSPPLKPGTVDARGRRHSKGLSSDKPLVDTGQMIRAVEYSVEDK